MNSIVIIKWHKSAPSFSIFNPIVPDGDPEESKGGNQNNEENRIVVHKKGGIEFISMNKRCFVEVDDSGNDGREFTDVRRFVLRPFQTSGHSWQLHVMDWADRGEYHINISDPDPDDDFTSTSLIVDVQ